MAKTKARITSGGTVYSVNWIGVPHRVPELVLGQHLAGSSPNPAKLPSPGFTRLVLKKLEMNM